MNTKKWLTLGLSVALAATAALAACAPTEPKEPDEGDNPSTPHTHTYTKWDHSDTEHWKVCPDDGELDVSSRAPHTVDKKTHTCECGYQEPHDHTYTKQAYDSTEHWMECPDDGAIDETTRADHSLNENGVCDCGYSVTKVYVAGHIASYPGSELPKIYERDGKNIGEEIAKYCPEMTLSEDGTTYTVEIYLVPEDYFGIYYTTWQNGRAVSAGEPFDFTGAYGKGGSGVMTVEKTGAYIISWTGPGKAATLREHDHTYTGWAYDATQHWKVCPGDGAVEPDVERQNHVYDQEGGKCVCGAVQTTSCGHSKGYAFQYETLPAVEADGGTLQKTCPDCGDTQDVTYSKGFTGTGDFSNIGTVGEISVGTYYFTTGNKSQALGMKITEAGTYTLTFEEVCDLGETDGQLGLDGLTFGTAYASKFSRASNSLVYGAAVTSKAAVKSQLQDYAVKVNEKNVAATADLAGNLVTLSFTVTDEQLQAGDLYVTIYLSGFKDNGHVSLATSDSLSHLVTVKKD